MTEQTPILVNPTLPAVPANDVDQIKLNLSTTGTGDYNLRNVAIPGVLLIRIKTFVKNLLYLVEPVAVPAQNDVSSLFKF
jgi:hypothetical protein